jgi:hypothetical protein
MIIGNLDPSLFLATIARIAILLVGVGLFPERAKADLPDEERFPIPKPVPFFGE